MASHEKAKYWSELNELSAREVLKSSKILFLFQCNNPECMHLFKKNTN